MQQTRVEQGLPYFNRFLEAYPTISDFAAAAEDDILKLWQGLGYYSRGRNMLVTAKLIVESYKGIFPSSYHELIKLKGIGEYTAAAIASFSANEAHAVVDGNVYRVLARYFGMSEPINSSKGKKLFQNLADELLDKEKPGLHNQAMMEFGAVLCKPKNPACGTCVLKEGCYAYLNNKVAQLPVKLKTVKIRQRFLNYFLITDGQTIVMNKRGSNDIWANMYDLPLVETAGLMEAHEVMALPAVSALFGAQITVNQVFPVQKHILTHQRLFVRFIKLHPQSNIASDSYILTEVKNLKNLAMPQIIFILLTKILNF